MGMGLFEYADAHPYQGTADEVRRQVADTISAAEDRETVKTLKTSIADQISQGREPQYILYTAVRAIAILTNDSKWEAEQREALDAVYSGIEQESLFRDRTADAIRQREDHLTAYTTKTSKRLKNSLNECRKLQLELETAIRLVSGMKAGIETEKAETQEE